LYPLVYTLSPILLFILLCLFFQINLTSINHIALASKNDDDRDSKDDDDEEEKDDNDDGDDEDRDSKDDDDEEEKDDNDDEDRDSKDDDDIKSSDIPNDQIDSKYDKFGIQKIYPTKIGGEEWYMNMQNIFDDNQFFPFGVSDSKFEDSNLKIDKNEDGSWKLRSDDQLAKVRMNVYTSEGYDPGKIETLDQSNLEDMGYMQTVRDWRNIEMTGYIKLNNNNIPLSEGRFTWYNRGGHHTENDPCEGVAYKGDIFFSGDTRFAKEQWHVKYFFTEIKNDLKSIKGKWIGYKFIIYNLEKTDSSKTMVKMEIWIDYNNNGNWKKINEYIDKGKWGDAGKKCDGKKDQIITWGGPIATFRWDKADDVDFKNFSVREIDS
jgi:hypothetical protein